MARSHAPRAKYARPRARWPLVRSEWESCAVRKARPQGAMTTSGFCSARHFLMSLAGCPCARPGAISATAAAAANERALGLTALRAGRCTHDGREALHPLEALRQLLAAKVEHDLAHAELCEGGDVTFDLAGRARERPALARARVQGLGRVIDRGLVGNSEAGRVTALRLREPAKLVQRRRQFVRAERHGGIGAHRMPAVSEARDPPERDLAVPA